MWAARGTQLAGRRGDTQGLRPILVIVGLALAFLAAVLVVWTSGRTAEWYRYVAGLQGVPPFVAALYGVRRLAARRRRGGAAATGNRYVAGLAVLVLGLLCWAAAEFGLLAYGLFADSLPLYPSWLDIGAVASIVCWAAVVFVTFEGYGEGGGRRFDFLKAVNDDSRMLAIFFGANIGLLAAFQGADLRGLVTPEAGPSAVGYALDAFFTTSDLFLLWMTARLVHGEPGRAMVRGRAALVLVAVGLGLLYAADLVFIVHSAVGEHWGHVHVHVPHYFGIVPDFGYVAAIACMSVAAQLYPTDPPVFAADER